MAALVATGSLGCSPSVSARYARQQQARLLVQVRSATLVDGVVVQPAYRSTPWKAEEAHRSRPNHKALVLFVSESGICRAPLAAAACRQHLQSSQIQEWVEVQARATRDYCLGQPPDPTAIAAAQQLGINMVPAAAAAAAVAAVASPPAAAAGGSALSTLDIAQQFCPAEDIVAADIVLVMDKYTAADVLREVSSYDLINPGGHYSTRVRLLGSFHPQLSAAAAANPIDGQDIDDPLYGNAGGPEEEAAMLQAAQLIQESCRNLVQHLEGLAATAGLLAVDSHNLPLADEAAAATGAATEAHESAAGVAASALSGQEDDAAAPGHNRQQQQGQQSKGAQFRDVLVQHVRENGVIEWLVPPMLQGSNTNVDGWV